jgi:hypothetical protein
MDLADDRCRTSHLTAMTVAEVATLFDIMVAGLLTNQAWVDTARYLSLLTNSALGFASPDSRAIPKPSRRVLMIRGVFDPRGTRLLRLLPVFRYPWLSQPSQPPRQAEFLAEVATTAGSVIRAPFSAGLGDDASREIRGAFEILVPAGSEIRLLRITDADRERTFGRLTRSKATPRLVVRSPRPGARLGARTTVRWTTCDSDTPAGSLVYQRAYSPNAGRNWVPLAVDFRGNAVTFDSTQIQKSNGRDVLRLFVSDGLNTAFADITKLTPTRARYPAPS